MTETTSVVQILDRYRPLVDEHIAAILRARSASPLSEIARYHLGFDAERGDGEPRHAGKRVRAALCLLSCEGAGGRPDAAGPAAAAVELVHSFTLLHDDIADRDETRRGRPTVWRRWGVGQAITAGDALFALANLALHRIRDAGVSADRLNSAAGELNSAVFAVCEGQHLDISYEGREDIAVPDYLRMIEGKTAPLFAAACGIGAMLGGAGDEAADAMRAFGRQLGLAFQIRDDMLGIWGDAADVGKPVGGDLRRNKRSLPVVYALSEASGADAADISDRLTRGVSDDEEATDLARRLRRQGAEAYCERMARESLAEALDHLARAHMREGPAADLRTLASYLVERAA